MKIKINREIFSKAIAEAACFVPSKLVVAIQKYAKITTKGNFMKIECGNNDASIVKYVELIECDIDDSFLIEVVELNRLISAVKGDLIEIETCGFTVLIKHQNGVVEFQGCDVKEFPIFKSSNKKDASEITVNAGVLADFITKGRRFVMNSTIKPQMSAVYSYIKNGRFGFCATDTTKMIHGSKQIEAPEDLNVHFLIMPAIFRSLSDICKKNSSSDAVVTITDGHVTYRIGNTIIQSIMAKEKYPDFQRILNISHTSECSVEKYDLIAALGRVIQICDDSMSCKFDISQMNMSISTSNFMSAKKINESIVHNGCDSELTIGMNANDVRMCAESFENGEILIRMSEPNRPLIFVQRDNPNIIALAMPLRLPA